MICSDCGRDTSEPRRGRCKACSDRFRRREKMCGRWQPTYVDAQPVREHVEALLSMGLSKRRIGVLAGVDREALRWLQNRSKSVKATTAKALLAVQIPDDVPLHRVAADWALVDSAGTQRRLQSLVAYGYTRAHLAERLAMSRTHLGQVMVRPRVTAQTARSVEKLFNELQFTPGPSSRARLEGRRNCWSVPFAWDEDELDSVEFIDPQLKNEKPKHLSLQERYDELRYLGFNTAQIADRLGLQSRVLQRLRETG